MKKILIPGIFVLIVIIFISLSNTQTSSMPEKAYRGIVVYPGDILSTGPAKLIMFLKSADLNVLGIHSNTLSEDLDDLRVFLQSDDGKTLLAQCKKNNILIEYETHALQEMLPRNLFEEHPEFFRMDENGVRQKDHNMCFSSEGAYQEIEKTLNEITKWLHPDTHRYFFWTDDAGEAFCKCEKCRDFSESEQSLIYENRLIEILRKTDPEATLAHLAYHNTLKAPVKVRPSEGIFLEYAPISRDYSLPLPEDHLKNIKENLEVFPAATAHVLEYWLDASMFSKWNRKNLMEIPWNPDYCERDIKMYTDFGIRSITTFGTWMINNSYLEKFGQNKAFQQVIEYGNILRKLLNYEISDTEIFNIKFIEREIEVDGIVKDEEWASVDAIKGLTAPWDTVPPDGTVFRSFHTGDIYYFCFEVKDSTITTFPFTDESTVMKEDRVELFFSSGPKMESYFCFEMDPFGYVLDYSAEHYRKFDRSWNFENMEIETGYTPAGYVVEGKISIKALRQSGIKDTFYLGVFRADYYGKNPGDVIWYTWIKPESEKPDFHIPSSLAKCRFEEPR